MLSPGPASPHLESTPSVAMTYEVDVSNGARRLHPIYVDPTVTCSARRLHPIYVDPTVTCSARRLHPIYVDPTVTCHCSARRLHPIYVDHTVTCSARRPHINVTLLRLQSQSSHQPFSVVPTFLTVLHVFFSLQRRLFLRMLIFFF